MHENIRDAIHSAAETGQKIAMFHFQVLSNATKLSSTDPVEFCRSVDVPVTFATEFRKMIALARLMREKGVTLT